MSTMPNMTFNCKEVDISNSEFGCTLTFADREEPIGIEDFSAEEIMESLGQYVLLQRTYSEFDNETDYCIIEMSDFDKSGELENFTIDFDNKRFAMKYGEYNILINLEIDRKTFNEIKRALKIIANNRGKLNINE